MSNRVIKLFIFGAFTYLSVFISCKSNTTNGNGESAANTDSFIVFKTVFKGTWVQTSYFDDIAKTKSPCKSQNKVAMLIAFRFDSLEIHGDSMWVGGVGIHEGQSFFVHFRKGFSATSLPTNLIDFDTVRSYYELGYEITGNDTSLSICHYNADKKLLDKEIYTRESGDAVAAFIARVNKKLVSGNYNFIDSSGHQQQAKFTDDGKVMGLTGHSEYFLNTDFVAGPENNLDEIILDNGTKNRKDYAYIIKEDTLSLYDTKESQDRQFLKRTQLRYQFIKQ